MHERPASELAGRWSYCLRYATRAVIGTLRPTDQRRANPEKREMCRSYVYCMHLADIRRSAGAMELTGIEPVTSAVRLQRSPS